MFDSEFCLVDYSELNKIVFLRWKKFCSGDHYREPVLYALNCFKEQKISYFVIDARNGFEDDQDDVDWGFAEFIPRLAETRCKNVIFIMNSNNDLAAEMSMWVKEFMTYFQVDSVISYEDALALIDKKYSPLSLNVEYTVKNGTRNEFYNSLNTLGIIRDSRSEPGNKKYDYYFSVENDNKILLLEAWSNQEEQENHLKTAHYQKLQQLKAEYVTNVAIEKFCTGRD